MKFEYDVFLSYSSSDRDAVVGLAEQLRDRGLKVWLDRWCIKPGESIPSAIEAGLSSSRVLLLCMSEHAFASDWVKLETEAVRFRDPMNRDLRFIPVRLDDAEPPPSLAHFQYVDLRDDGAVEVLLRSCQLPAQEPGGNPSATIPVTSISLGHAGPVTGVAYSPNGQHAITTSDDRTARIWDTATGQTTTILEGHTGTVWGVAYSPNGQHAITTSGDRTARIWDTATGQTTTILEGHTGPVWGVAYSPNGQHAITTSDDRTARIWDTATGQTTTILEGHTGPVRGVAYSPNGQHAITTSGDRTARIWDTTTGQTTTILEGHTGTVRGVAYSPNGQHAITTSGDRTARIWDTATGQTTTILLQGHTGTVTGVAYSPNGQHAITTSDDRTARIWDTATGQTTTILEGHTGTVTAVAYSPNGQHAITTSGDRTARIWDTTTGQTTTILEGHTDYVWGVAYSPNDQHAITTSDDRTARIWDTATGQTTTILEGHTGPVWGVAYSPNGQHAITTSDDRTARIWDTATGQTTTILEGHTGPVWGVAYSPNGQHAITTSDDRTARIWDTATGQTTTILEGHTGPVWGVAYSPNGQHAITTSNDRTARIWDTTTGQTTTILEGHTDYVTGVAYSPNGQHAITTSDDRTARIWDTTTGQTTTILEGHTDYVTGVAYSPNGQHTITTSTDNTARIWDTTTGQTTTILEGHTDSVWGVAYSPNGQHAITVAANGVMRRWVLGQEILREQLDSDSVVYTNAKVLLVGESRAGKSGLAIRLAQKLWHPTESTVGAWATQFQVELDTHTTDETREVWLWDFGGQADQRLIHQLYLADAALAILVFDGERDDVITKLWEWDRAIEAANPNIPKLLVAGRIDTNPVLTPRQNLDRFCELAHYGDLIATSAKENIGCEDLLTALVEAIDWASLPGRSSPKIFRLIRSEVLAMKDRGRVLTTFKELRDWLPTKVGDFTEAQLEAVLSLLIGPGIIARPKFGDHILLQPELINSYGQAVIKTLLNDPDELGALAESTVLEGAELTYPSDFERIDPNEEEIVLRSLHAEIVRRGLCVRVVAPGGQSAQLVFPTYYRRERPDRPSAPNVFTRYTFAGPIEEVYPSLIARVHYTERFAIENLWRNVADFTIDPSASSCGIQLRKHDNGSASLDLYADAGAAEGDKLVFEGLIKDHLDGHAKNVVRQRYYHCSACEQRAADPKIAARRLAAGEIDFGCQYCESRIAIWDSFEEQFGSDDLRAIVDQQRDQVQQVRQREARRGRLLGEVASAAIRAHQRIDDGDDSPFDLRINFCNDDRTPTGQFAFAHAIGRQLAGPQLIEVDRAWLGSEHPIVVIAETEDDQIEWVLASDLLPTDAPAPSTVRFNGQRLTTMSLLKFRDEVTKAPDEPRNPDEPRLASNNKPRYKTLASYVGSAVAAAAAIATLIAFGMELNKRLADEDKSERPPAPVTTSSIPEDEPNSSD